jgi:hypothetical protein
VRGTAELPAGTHLTMRVRPPADDRVGAAVRAGHGETAGTVPISLRWDQLRHAAYSPTESHLLSASGTTSPSEGRAELVVAVCNRWITTKPRRDGG